MNSSPNSKHLGLNSILSIRIFLLLAVYSVKSEGAEKKSKFQIFTLHFFNMLVKLPYFCVSVQWTVILIRDNEGTELVVFNIK